MTETAGRDSEFDRPAHALYNGQLRQPLAPPRNALAPLCQG
jgi:hypothetical protein